MVVTCYLCHQALDRPGALVFSPPDTDHTSGNDVCQKRHICIECWEKEDSLIQQLDQERTEHASTKHELGIATRLVNKHMGDAHEAEKARRQIETLTREWEAMSHEARRSMEDKVAAQAEAMHLRTRLEAERKNYESGRDTIVQMELLARRIFAHVKTEGIDLPPVLMDMLHKLAHTA